MKQKNSKKRHPLDSGKRIGAEYLIFPLVFCLLLGAVCAPLIYGVYGRGRTALIAAQQTEFAATANDAQAVVTYGAPETGLPRTPFCEGYARLQSADLGIDTLVYFGFNRASLREGAAQVENAKIGSGRLAVVGGYEAGVFAGLTGASAGDRVTVSTNDAVYEYTVQTVLTAAQSTLADLDLAAQDDRLILFTTYPSGPFATNQDQLFIAVCTPQAETEVAP